MTMGFCMVRATVFLSPLKLSFSLVFFITVTDAGRGLILESYAIPPTPLEVAPDFPWIIRFSECHSQRFRCEVRQLNSLSEFFTEV